jgi:nitrate reductase molybdenum cofactor assembly chaperone
MQAELYNSVAQLLTYPGEDYLERVRTCAALSHDLAAFAEAIAPLSAIEMQELFTRTFDLNPLCCLEIGWHLFGENYERGTLMVRMRQELRRYGLEESTELPDHLCHVLRLLARMEAERAGDFAAACVLPALEKMLTAFQGKENPFERLLLATRELVRGDFPEIRWLQEPIAALRVLS